MIDLTSMSSIERLAYELARYYHRNQRRKYTDDPYIVHCHEIVEILRDIPGTTVEMLCAAWLHDTLEDTDIPVIIIDLMFGKSVLMLVYQLTHPSHPEDGNRATRKKMDRDFLSRVSPEAQTIKLADMISNSQSIMERDPKFASVYIPEMRELLIVLTRGNETLRNRVAEIIK